MASSRYYEDKDNQIQPGKISDDLRKALNLAENDIPIWIYRMRAIGYPPGWLRKAVVDTSDIFCTDTPSNSDNDDEQQQIGGSGSKRKRGPDRGDEVKYDPKKLVEYPGFNTPSPPNTFDYHYYYNMPPMLAHQQLDFAKQTMSQPAEPTSSSSKRARASFESSTANQSSNSLDVNSSVKDKDKQEDDKSSESIEEDTPASPDPEPSNVDESDESAASTNLKSNDSRSTSLVNNRSSVSLNSSLNEEIKLVSKGSPMPEKVKRCDLEKFSQGVVGELLYFQNIPGSTGKFENIRGLLNTMRRSKSEADTSLASSTKSATKDDKD